MNSRSSAQETGGTKMSTYRSRVKFAPDPRSLWRDVVVGVPTEPLVGFSRYSTRQSDSIRVISGSSATTRTTEIVTSSISVHRNTGSWHRIGKDEQVEERVFNAALRPSQRSLDAYTLECWQRTATLTRRFASRSHTRNLRVLGTPVTAFAVRLHVAGVSLRETKAILA